jgi:hypothetical protein
METNTETGASAQALVQELREKYSALDEVQGRLREQMDRGVMNPIELGRWIGVNPPRIYGDIRAGRVNGVTDNNTQKIVIPVHEALAYAHKVLGKRAALALKKELEDQALEAQITAELEKAGSAQ